MPARDRQATPPAVLRVLTMHDGGKLQLSAEHTQLCPADGGPARVLAYHAAPQTVSV